MTPAETWSVVDFWAGLPWPLSRADAQQRAVDRLGWTIEVENGLGYLYNRKLMPPEVSMGGIETVSFVRFPIADQVTEETPETRAYLGDLFTLTVRAGAARSGRPAIRRDHGGTHATWDDVIVTQSRWLVAVRYLTPEGR